jgi:putative tryptophan/tyrosine transport system substrate-binding protein
MRCNGLVSLIFAATLVSSAPLGAQQRNNPTIGFLTSGSLAALNEQWMAGFHRGLGESGLVDGQNVSIEYRAADDKYERLDGFAAEFVRNNVGVIVAAGGPVSALAAKRASSTIPIVFTTIADPVKSGLVDGFAKPGGNATGTAGLTSELDVKRMEMLHQVKPSIRVVGVLINPNRPGVEANNKELQAAAQTMGLRLIFQNAGPEHPIEAAFEKLAAERIDALVVTADPFFNFRRPQVIALAARYSFPAIYQWREFVAGGGLMSYGPGIGDAYQQAGIYAGRILKGERPADLPVIQPTRFELVINQKTAKTLGLDVPAQMLARANDVIE